MDSHVDIRQESVMQAFAKSLLSASGALCAQRKRSDVICFTSGVFRQVSFIRKCQKRVREGRNRMRVA
jgi:hypothetical protein